MSAKVAACLGTNRVLFLPMRGYEIEMLTAQGILPALFLPMRGYEPGDKLSIARQFPRYFSP